MLKFMFRKGGLHSSSFTHQTKQTKWKTQWAWGLSFREGQDRSLRGTWDSIEMQNVGRHFRLRDPESAFRLN